jgi:hypothetical protein
MVGLLLADLLPLDGFRLGILTLRTSWNGAEKIRRGFNELLLDRTDTPVSECRFPERPVGGERNCVKDLSTFTSWRLSDPRSPDGAGGVRGVMGRLGTVEPSDRREESLEFPDEPFILSYHTLPDLVRVQQRPGRGLYGGSVIVSGRLLGECGYL